MQYSSKIFQQFPVIDIGEYILRELDVSDAQNFLFYMKDEKLSKYIADIYVPKNLRESEHEIKYWADLYKSKQSFYWGIAVKSSNMLIGSCGFGIWNKTDARAEVSYDLSRKFWNQGIMTKAMKAMCDFAFYSMNVNRIQATVVIDNTASIKLLEKIGFKREAMLREYACLRGVRYDSYMYSYLRKDSFEI